MRPRGEYLFRAVLCYILAGAFLIGTPSLHKIIGMKFFHALGIGISLALLSVLIGYINHALYKRDKNEAKAKDERIKELEKENKRLKRNNHDES